MKKSNSAIIVFGSSRSDGHTREAVNNLFKQLDLKFPLIDLAEFDVKEFDYHFKQNDDFKSLIKNIVTYDLIVFATPIYWYSVSAKMKVFIDRLSDLLIVNKDIGRQLRGKKLAVISSYYTYPEGKDGFELPLKNTGKYLGMTYVGTYFHYSGDDPMGKKNSDASLTTFAAAVLKHITPIGRQGRLKA